jgi:serine/threonine-protein kinase
MIGKTIGDRFVVQEELGSGGMSAVHRGLDTRLNEAVAIKFLRKGYEADPVVRERFRREAMSLAKLRHPGIVAVLDFGEADGAPYIVLELVKGTTLEVALFRGRLDPLRASAVFDQVLAALEICHANGVVHRDIKPSNIMLAGDLVTLIDFGLAWVDGPESTKLTETGTVHGTPSYMAPEQCRGLDISPATDIYAVGIVMYEAMAGRPPFHGDSAAVLMAQQLFSVPAPMPEVAPGVEAAIMHALSKNPEDRPTARDLRDALGAAFRGTDPRAIAAAAAQQRAVVAGLPRHERALTGRPPAADAASEPAPGISASVALWMPDGNRAANLRASLGTAGIPCQVSNEAEPPAADLVIISGLERASKLEKRAFLVVDVGGPEQTTLAIRAGASDMLLGGAPDADVIPKIRKVLRRKRR